MYMYVCEVHVCVFSFYLSFCFETAESERSFPHDDGHHAYGTRGPTHPAAGTFDCHIDSGTTTSDALTREGVATSVALTREAWTSWTTGPGWLWVWLFLSANFALVVHADLALLAPVLAAPASGFRFPRVRLRAASRQLAAS